MSTPVRQHLTVATADGPLRLLRWGDEDRTRPVALLVHGTGFCASVWDAVAARLAEDFVVYALDRRGHGASKKPWDAYDFADFADDIVDVIDALELHDALAIGHSAGGTDVLLAAPQRPHALRRILVIEPTMADPHEPEQRPELTPAHHDTLESLARRRTSFPSHDAAVSRYRERGVFAGWQPALLEAYVTDAFDHHPDGSISLRCTPTIEAAMLRRIFAAMEGSSTGERGDNPFRSVGQIECPTLILTTEHSQPIYEQMAGVAHRLVPQSSIEHLDGVGHAVTQVDPDRIAARAVRFWHDSEPFGAR